MDGYGHPEEYLKQAQNLCLKAFAITEHGNEYSWVYFDLLKKNYPDVKMIYGVELYECFDMSVQDQTSKYFHLIALAKNERGRIALNEIVTQSNFDGFYFKPRVDLRHLKPYAKDLIVSSACLASKLAREPDYAVCVQYVNEYKSIFPHFYLEMQSHATQDQCDYNKKILQLSKDTSTPYIITTDSHAATKEDLYYQGRHVQIAHDTETMSELYDGCYMQSDDEIYNIMSAQIGEEAVAVGLQNTDVIADMVETVNMPFQSPQLPTYPLPDGYADNYDFLKSLVEKGWYERGIDKLSKEKQKERRERINYELSVIHQMGFDGYFLFVWDFIRYAKETKMAIGDGRGSGGGSMVVFLLGITELDPIENGLIFERFLNPERISMPDLDCDFADRDALIKYLITKYGEERVCQIINFSYITPVVAIKDVGKVLSIPYNVCDKISKKFIYKTFDECIEKNPSLHETYADYNELFDIASHISGRVRNASIHAGGVGIVDTKITDYMAMKLGSNGEHVIQVDKKIIEDIGIIKFDVLGVATLGVVQEIMQDVGLKPEDISINNPKFANDDAMYKLLQSAKTNGVFQVESAGMKDLLTRLVPTTLEDMSAVLALYRPDSMSMLDDYIYYKHHENEVKYWHPDMEPLLKSTYGCIIYQEEIMDIVRVMGGRTYGGADKFRKGIGKKDVELVKKEADKLYEEIVNNNYDEALSKKISDYMATMGGYSFNKSHSKLYAILTLKTAYLKAHYPAYFFKALLNQNRSDYGTLNKYIADAKDFGVQVLPPKINQSDRYFKVHNGKVLFGLEAIRGIGEKVVTQILEEREKGLFLGFEDFCNRVKPSTSAVVALIKSGAIPCKNKASMLKTYAQSLFEEKEYKPVSSLPTKKILLEKWGIDSEKIKDKELRLGILNVKKKEEFYIQQEIKRNQLLFEFKEKYMGDEKFWEFETLSIFLGENPFDASYKYINVSYEDAEEGGDVTLIGVIANVQKKKDRNGGRFAFINLYSTFGLMEVICWSSQYKQYEEMIKRGEQIAILCKKGSDDKAPTIKQMKPYSLWLKQMQERRYDS